MKWFSLSILLLFSLTGEDTALDLAKNAYDSGDYQESISQYREASRKFPEQGSQIRYNIAQCYTRMEQDSMALVYYVQASRSSNSELASQAFNNLGELLIRQGESDQAKIAFMNALGRNPENEKARFNFELISRRLEDEKEDEEPEQPDVNPPLPENEPPSSLSPEAQRFWEEILKTPRRPIPGDEAVRYPLDTLPISDALRILEAMRREDRQYLQQLKKKMLTPGSKNEGLPDW